MCLHCVTVTMKERAHGIRIQLDLNLIPAGKERKRNLIFATVNGFQEFGTCVCI